MLRSKLVREFNAENLLAVLGVLLGWRVPLQQALVALAACVAPPGRMEVFGGGTRPLVLVDYAHSPDALEKVLDAARAARAWASLLASSVAAATATPASDR